MTNIEGDRPRRPAEVERSLFCWWFAIGAQVLSDVVQIILPSRANSLTQLVLHQGQGPDSTASVAGIVMQVVTLVIWAALVHNVGLGSNGARWVLTILGGIEEVVLLGVIAICFLFPSVGSILTGIVGLAVFGFALMGIIDMHRPGAALHFQRLT